MSFSRKLEIAHWNQGKGCKGSRKAKLRVQAESEIHEQIAELDEGYRTKHGSKRKPNNEARLQFKIDYYQRVVDEYERQFQSDRQAWRCGFASWARNALRRAKIELQELQEKKNELRSQ